MNPLPNIPFSDTAFVFACSVRTPISMKFFPRFFLLYFLVFHIYFFSYTYGNILISELQMFAYSSHYFPLTCYCQHAGFSYLALSTSAAFMQHLVLYFWNRFEVKMHQSVYAIFKCFQVIMNCRIWKLERVV